MGFTAGTIAAFGYTATQGKALPYDVVQAVMDELVAMETAFINGRARCSAYHNTTQSLTSGLGATLSLNSEDFDVGTMHDTSTNNTRVTIPAGNNGVYMVIGGTAFQSNATGYRQLTIVKNAITTIASVIVPVNSGTVQTNAQVTVMASLVASDYLELNAVQTSGGSLSVGSATRFDASFLQVVRMW